MLAYPSDRVLCYTSCNASVPLCSTYPQTPACENKELPSGQGIVLICFVMWCQFKNSLGVVAFSLRWLYSSSASPGTVGPGRPLSPASIHCFWEFSHNHTFPWDTPLKRKSGNWQSISLFLLLFQYRSWCTIFSDRKHFLLMLPIFSPSPAFFFRTSMHFFLQPDNYLTFSLFFLWLLVQRCTAAPWYLWDKIMFKCLFYLHG